MYFFVADNIVSHELVEAGGGRMGHAGNFGMTILLLNMWFIPFNLWLPYGGRFQMPSNGVT